MGKKIRNKIIEHNEETDETTYAQEEYDDGLPEAPAAPEVVEEHKVDFDGWYGARAKKIPGHHHKEIIKADFKARKVPVMATMAEFDAALKKYGLKLS